MKPIEPEDYQIEEIDFDSHNPVYWEIEYTLRR